LSAVHDAQASSSAGGTLRFLRGQGDRPAHYDPSVLRASEGLLLARVPQPLLSVPAVLRGHLSKIGERAAGIRAGHRSEEAASRAPSTQHPVLDSTRDHRGIVRSTSDTSAAGRHPNRDASRGCRTARGP
jgi:hypothetical protein